MPSRSELEAKVEKMLQLAATRLPGDVKGALESALDEEEEPIARKQLKNILENLEIAERRNVPICQDTGLPVFFIKLGRDFQLDFDIGKALENSIERATESVPLRPNVVDPLSRENSGNNLGRGHPLVHLTPKEGEKFEIELMLKGAGSENWSRLFTLNPTDSGEEILDRVVRTVESAGGQVCPPSILGIGIGGTADEAGILAKKALLRPLDEENRAKSLSKLEEKITKSANETGIGPMGLGGRSTVLGSRIETAGCHTASLPVALNFSCWACRRSKGVLRGGEIEIEVPR